MSETCAVCKKGIGPTKCEICGFSDDGSINRSFPIPEDLSYWLETVVKPYRALWEARKRENELSAQLEEAKKREAELLARVNSLANKETETTRILPPPQQPPFSKPMEKVTRDKLLFLFKKIFGNRLSASPATTENPTPTLAELYMSKPLPPQAAGIYRELLAHNSGNVSEAKKNCFYFTNGLKGVFLQSRCTSEFRNGSSIYCFKKINENEALVSVVNELSVVNRIRYNPDALDGICEQLNQADENTKVIETVEPGKAVIEDDKWRIKKVVKIRYL